MEKKRTQWHAKDRAPQCGGRPGGDGRHRRRIVRPDPAAQAPGAALHGAKLPALAAGTAAFPTHRGQPHGEHGAVGLCRRMATANGLGLLFGDTPLRRAFCCLEIAHAKPSQISFTFALSVISALLKSTHHHSPGETDEPDGKHPPRPHTAPVCTRLGLHHTPSPWPPSKAHHKQHLPPTPIKCRVTTKTEGGQQTYDGLFASTGAAAIDAQERVGMRCHDITVVGQYPLDAICRLPLAWQ